MENLTPEQVVEQINVKFDEKLTGVATKSDVESLKSDVETLKAMEQKSADIEKAIAKMEGRLEAMAEKAITPTEKTPKTLSEALIKAFNDNVEKISEGVEKRQAVNMNVKVDTTITGNYSGNVALSTLEAGVNRIARPIRRMREIANVGTTLSKFVTYIQQTVQPIAGWVGEAGDKYNTTTEYNEVSEEVKKVAGYIKVSKEMLADLAFVRSEINMDLMEAIEQNIDDAILNGAGGTSLTGLIGNVPAFAAGSFAGAVPSANIQDVIRIAKANIEAANFMPTHVVLNPEDVAKIELTKTTSGEYTYPSFWDANMNVAGLMVVSSNNIAAGTLLVGDFTKLNLKFREDVNLQVGYENDDFTRNMVTILAEARLVSYVKGNDVNAFVEADLATAIAAIDAP